MARQDEVVKERLKKLEELKKQGVNPYLSKYSATHTASALQEKYKSLKNGETTKDAASIVGRLVGFRDLGKITFGVIDDGTARIQITLQDKETPANLFAFVKKYIDTGDFIGVKGTVIRTQRGELSILVKEAQLVTKSIYPLPEQWYGLEDKEERLRKRYLDIMLNPEIKAMFIRKNLFWNTIRQFLLERGFIEVETPVLENATGGAAATPFATHHNALDLDVYLRISMGELWQKRLMVAGFPKTFEIGRQFRNEGMDAEHLQDYTQMEFYWAYANYEDGMTLVEELYKKIAKNVFGKTTFTVGEHSFDINKKWGRIDYVETIKKETGVDVLTASAKELENKLLKLRQEFPRGAERVRLIDSLWKYCRKSIVGPAFLTGQLVEVSPLAKRSSLDSRKVEQFQIIIAGSEVGNGYSELNDPLDQESRFAEQQHMKDSGDSEAHMHDADFVDALKYGMPPTCGFGVSERLFAFLEGKPIRETVIFPLMRPEIKLSSKEQKKEKEVVNNGRHRPNSQKQNKSRGS
jgi:lysyl-tRNA synthetase class 2